MTPEQIAEKKILEEIKYLVELERTRSHNLNRTKKPKPFDQAVRVGYAAACRWFLTKIISPRIESLKNPNPQ